MSRSTESAAFVRRLAAVAPALWMAALLLFGVGDVATTLLSYPVAGVRELGPVGRVAYRQGPLALGAVKVAALGACYALYRRAPDPQSVGVPLALAATGALVTAWNAFVVASAL